MSPPGKAKRRWFRLGPSWALLRTLAIFAGFALLARAHDVKGAGPKRPNILWLVGENIKLDLGCYGARHVHTPHLDRLAAGGMRFTRVFATAPVCSASRSAFMTGMCQTTTGTHNARSHRDDGYQLPAGVRLLTHRLRDAGYFTANIKSIDGHVVGTGKVDLNFNWVGKLFDSDNWDELKGRQPFFAQVNSPEVEYDIYDRRSAEKERVLWVGESEHPPVARPDDVRPPAYYPDHPIVRQEWARYLNSVSGMDVRIGRVLAKLAADGLADDTVVMFFADNGRLEARGIHWCYDSGLHVPLIVHWPKNFPPPSQYRSGAVVEQVVSLIDVTATTLAIAGLPKPEAMQGRVLLGEHADPPREFAFSARDRIDESVQRIRSVRSTRYRYIRNFTPEHPFSELNRYKEKCFLVMPLMRKMHEEGRLNAVQAALFAPRLPDEELYDLAADPEETRNLALSSDPKHLRELARHRAALERWIAETKDQGRVLEPAEIVAPFVQEMHAWFGTPAWHK
jgi:arylsulfatase A-like enzyme